MTLPNLSDAAELRRRAEARLSEKQKTQRSQTGAERTSDDTPRLVQELQIHQIELEIQNQELQQARTETHETLERYTDLYDFAPLGYFTLKRDGTIRQANLTGSELLGVDRWQLVNRRFGLFVAENSRLGFLAFTEKVFASQSRESCEAMLLREGKSSFYARIEATSLDNGQECRAVVVDITERVGVEERLRQSERRLVGIIDSAMDGIISVDEQQRILVFNSAAEKIFGYTASEMLGQQLDRLIPERFRAAHMGHIRKFEQTHLTHRTIDALGTVVGLRANGEEFPIEASISQTTAGGVNLFTAILRTSPIANGASSSSWKICGSKRLAASKASSSPICRTSCARRSMGSLASRSF